MLLRLAISVFLVVVSWCVQAQSLEQTYALAVGFYNDTSDVEAEESFQRVIYFDSLHHYTDSYNYIAEIKLRSGQFVSARKYFEVYKNYIQDDSLTIDQSFKFVQCYLFQSLYNEAISELILFEDALYNDTLKKKWTLYLAVAYFQNGQFIESEKLFKQLVAKEEHEKLEELFQKNNKLERKYRKFKVQLMSALLPGSGQMYTGHVFAGFNSAALVGGFLYLFIHTSRVVSVMDAVLSVYPWLSRYYKGGVKKAGLFAEEKVIRKRREYYTNILEVVKLSH